MRRPLRKGEIFTFTPGVPVRVEAVAGILWVTCEGDPRDHVLEPGRELHVAAGCRVVMEPLDGGAEVSLQIASSIQRRIKSAPGPRRATLNSTGGNHE